MTRCVRCDTLITGQVYVHAGELELCLYCARVHAPDSVEPAVHPLDLSDVR